MRKDQDSEITHAGEKGRGIAHIYTLIREKREIGGHRNREGIFNREDEFPKKGEM